MQTSPPPQKGFQGPNPITVTRTWGAVGRAAMQKTSVVCYFIFFPQDQAAAGGAAREQPTGWRKPSQPRSCFSALNPIKGAWGQHLRAYIAPLEPGWHRERGER